LPAAALTGGVLTIDLAAVEANWKRLAGMTIPVECAAVVKGDGYGCGLEPVTAMLARAGCRTFFVAHIAEARRVRAIAPNAVIYVLNGIAPGSAGAFADANLRPVIGNLAELAEWDAFTSSTGWKGEHALHFDTGMNRLGFAIEEAPALAPRASKLDHGIALIMSHLACAETPNHPLNERQITAFRDLRTLFRGLPASLANSSGIFLGGATHCDMVRPGVALYGVNPTPGHYNPMRPVIEVKGRIVQVRKVERGVGVGYGATWSAERSSRIAIISAGYADGFSRAASSTETGHRAEVIVGGRHCPVVGRISMDLLAVDVTALPENTVKRGEYATLIGGRIGVDEFAAAIGTIGYEVLTSLGRRYTRKYRVS
jgi:alanine racemase